MLSYDTPTMGSLLVLTVALHLIALTALPLSPASSVSVHMQNATTFFASPHSSNFILNSNNGRFSCGWVSTPDDKYTFSVVFVPGSIGAPQIWIANRNHPVSRMATVRFDGKGALVLKEANGDIVWWSNTANARNIVLEDSGNLVLLDGEGNKVWQSFDHPSDTMLQGQTIHTGAQIISSHSSSNVAEGIYSVVIEPGGLIMYVKSKSSFLPYHVVGFSSSDNKNTVDSVRNPYCKGTSFTYSYGGAVVTFKQEDVGKVRECNRSFDVQVGSNDTTTDLKFLRLDPDGNFRTYLYRLHYGWGIDEEVFSGSMVCALPNKCGSIGLCSSYGDCACPRSNLEIGNTFNMIESSDPTSGCRPLQRPTCNGSNSFVQLMGVNYFANDFLYQRTESLEECRRICERNCSCAAAFYRQKTGNCYHYQSILSMQRVSDRSFIAILKIGNESVSIDKLRSFARPRYISKKIQISIAFGATLTLLSLLSLIVLCFRTRRKMMEKSMDDAFLETLPGLPLRFSLRELYKATDGFRKRLGSGGFGSVYEGILSDGSKVAVKRLEGFRQGNKEFHAEVAALGSISHLNLVRLRGFCAEKAHRLLVYDYMPNGSLEKWLFSRNDEDKFLNWCTRFKIATDTARGLAFLHEESRERIVHLDIKPQNILLDESFTAKLSDFGLSKLIDRTETNVVTNMRGTPGYVAPEWLLGAAVTNKSDVYSFGMVLLELLSGRRNVDPSRETLWYFPAWAVMKVERGNMMEVLDARVRDFSCAEQAEAAMRMIKTALWCIQQDPALRPSMSTVLRMLEGHTTEVQIPPSLLTTQVAKSKEMAASLNSACYQDYWNEPPISQLHISDWVLSGPR